jgi:hypothetical protein
LLFPNPVLLAGIGLWVWGKELQPEKNLPDTRNE